MGLLGFESAWKLSKEYNVICCFSVLPQQLLVSQFSWCSELFFIFFSFFFTDKKIQYNTCIHLCEGAPLIFSGIGDLV